MSKRVKRLDLKNERLVISLSRNAGKYKLSMDIVVPGNQMRPMRKINMQKKEFDSEEEFWFSLQEMAANRQADLALISMEPPK